MSEKAILGRAPSATTRSVAFVVDDPLTHRLLRAVVETEKPNTLERIATTPACIRQNSAPALRRASASILRTAKMH